MDSKNNNIEISGNENIALQNIIQSNITINYGISVDKFERVVSELIKTKESLAEQQQIIKDWYLKYDNLQKIIKFYPETDISIKIQDNLIRLWINKLFFSILYFL